MNVRTIIVLLIMGIAAPAFADYQVVVDAVETSSSLVKFPTTQNSTLSFKRCKECDSESVRLTPYTDFILRGERIKFDGFRQGFKKLRRDDEYVLISYDVKTNTVTSIRVAD